MDDVNFILGENPPTRSAKRSNDSTWTTGIFDYESHRDLPPAFWGDIDKYLDWLSPPLGAEPSHTQSAAVAQPPPVVGALVGDSKETERAPEVEPPTLQEKVSVDVATERHSDYKIYKQEGTNLASVEELRRSYMLGKLAGEDLYSPTGQLIARKHQVISKEVIEEAERAGKLVQLIVHMVIPGLGE